MLIFKPVLLILILMVVYGFAINFIAKSFSNIIIYNNEGFLNEHK